MRMLVSGPFYSFVCLPEPGLQPRSGVSISGLALGQKDGLYNPESLPSRLIFHDCNAHAPWRNIWPAAPLHSLHHPFPQCFLPRCKSFTHSLLSSAALCFSLSSCNTIAVGITVTGSPGGSVAVSLASRRDTRRKMLQKQCQLFSAAELCCGSPSPAAAGKAAIMLSSIPPLLESPRVHQHGVTINSPALVQRE